MNQVIRTLGLALGIVTAGIVGSARATVIATVWNPVPNGAITIDGNMSDWTAAGLTPVVTDPIGDEVTPSTYPDYVAGWIANDSNNVYFRFDASTAFTYQFASTWFDLDKNSGTGYSFAGVGAERNTNDGFSGPTAGALNYWNAGGGYVTTTYHPSYQSVDGKSVEYSIPLSELSSDFYVVWTSNNDVMPNAGGVVEYIITIPEPSTLVLLGMGGFVLWLRRRNRLAGRDRTRMGRERMGSGIAGRVLERSRFNWGAAAERCRTAHFART